MLHPHPELVHLGKVELDVVDRVLDGAVLVRARLLKRVRKDVPRALQQVVPEMIRYELVVLSGESTSDFIT